MKESGHLVSFLSVFATTLLSWQYSRWPQHPSPTLYTSDRKERTPHINSSGIPSPSLSTPNTVKAEGWSNQFSYPDGPILLTYYPETVSFANKEQRTKNPLTIHSHTAQDFWTHYQCQIQAAMMNPSLLTVSSIL